MATKLITDACEIAYRLEGPAEAPVVLFANGLGMDMSMWSSQGVAFEGYRVLRYDLRGHGGTPATRGDYSIEMLGRDLVGLVRSLHVGPVHLVGTSLGAMVGLHVALADPEALASLTLCATTSDPPRAAWDERIRSIRHDGLAPYVGAIVGRWFMPQFAASRPDEIERLAAMVLGTSLDGYLGCAAAIRDMRLAKHIHSIGCPTLVIAGDEDRVTPLIDLEFIQAQIQGARLVRIAAAGHMPTIEQPDACNAAILAFLAEHARAPVHSEDRALATAATNMESQQ